MFICFPHRICFFFCFFLCWAECGQRTGCLERALGRGEGVDGWGTGGRDGGRWLDGCVCVCVCVCACIHLSHLCLRTCTYSSAREPRLCVCVCLFVGLCVCSFVLLWVAGWWDQLGGLKPFTSLLLPWRQPAGREGEWERGREGVERIK